MLPDPYQAIITIEDTHLLPTVKLTPILEYTTIGKSIITQTVRLEIETRGMDGSYSRSYTDKVLNEKSY